MLNPQSVFRWFFFFLFIYSFVFFSHLIVACCLSTWWGQLVDDVFYPSDKWCFIVKKNIHFFIWTKRHFPSNKHMRNHMSSDETYFISDSFTLRYNFSYSNQLLSFFFCLSQLVIVDLIYYFLYKKKNITELILIWLTYNVTLFFVYFNFLFTIILSLHCICNLKLIITSFWNMYIRIVYIQYP